MFLDGFREETASPEADLEDEDPLTSENDEEQTAQEAIPAPKTVGLWFVCSHLHDWCILTSPSGMTGDLPMFIPCGATQDDLRSQRLNNFKHFNVEWENIKDFKIPNKKHKHRSSGKVKKDLERRIKLEQRHSANAQKLRCIS